MVKFLQISRSSYCSEACDEVPARACIKACRLGFVWLCVMCMVVWLNLNIQAIIVGSTHKCYQTFSFKVYKKIL